LVHTLSLAAWGLALGLVALALILVWRVTTTGKASQASQYSLPGIQAAIPALSHMVSGAANNQANIPLPTVSPTPGESSIARRSLLHTYIPERSPQEAIKYQVEKGDSVFQIARRFKLHPESVLWGNYTSLKDNPDLLAVGMDLLIPPTDGVLYQWQAGDTVSSVAGRFGAKIEAVLNWPGNAIDLVDPQIQPGTWVMVPGGHREFRQWLIPTIPRGAAGVSAALYGAGACPGNYTGANGSGSFAWPSTTHTLSGNDYWDGHLAIDIGIGEGQPIMAADNGVVVFAGWATGGYGNMVMIDHGNGYQTLYGHMSKVASTCGQSVSKGQTIGYAGSTGNSTGPHLHFEVRYLGGFVNPWYVLPPP
jgi:hypothetical protein